MNESCLICGDKLEKDGELCNTCLDFFTTKYKTGFKKELDRFRKAREFLEQWRLDKKEVDE